MAEKKVETTNVEDQDVKPGAPDVQGPAALPTRERQQFANSELPICDASHPLHKFLLDAMELAKNVDGLNQDDWSRERSTCAKCHLPTAQAYLRTAHQASLSDWEVGGLLRSFMETLLSEHSRGLPGAGGKTEAGQYLETRIEAKVKEFKTPYRGVIFGPSLFGSKQSTTFSQSQVSCDIFPICSILSDSAEGSTRCWL